MMHELLGVGLHQSAGLREHGQKSAGILRSRAVELVESNLELRILCNVGLEGFGFLSLDVDREITGAGIPDIPVTDGYTYTVTDANGVYQLKASRYTRNIYMSVPSEFKIPLDAGTHLPLFYSTSSFDHNKVNRNDFTLEPQAVEDKFTMIMIGDPQCQTTAQINRYKTETVPAMIACLNGGHAEGRYPNAYGMTLGDITFDSTDLWAGMKETMSNLKLQDGSWFPIFQCIGNHDHNSLEQSGDYAATGKYVEFISTFRSSIE